MTTIRIMQYSGEQVLINSSYLKSPIKGDTALLKRR